MEILLIVTFSIAFAVLAWIFIAQKLWKRENLKHFFRNENHNYIPDGIEDIVNEVKERITNVKEEAKDVKEAIKEVGEEVEDIIQAAKGKKRKGRKPKK